MVKLLSVSAFILSCFAATLTYASNVKPGPVAKLDEKKQPCKTSEKLFSEKLLKIKPLSDTKTAEKNSTSSPSIKAPAAADTFESLIAPFIKTVSPHFYDQIIKRKDQKPLAVQS